MDPPISRDDAEPEAKKLKGPRVGHSFAIPVNPDGQAVIEAQKLYDEDRVIDQKTFRAKHKESKCAVEFYDKVGYIGCVSKARSVHNFTDIANQMKDEVKRGLNLTKLRFEERIMRLVKDDMTAEMAINRAKWAAKHNTWRELHEENL